jgi:hypothetical protein
MVFGSVGSAQAVKLARVQGHVLSVPVDCTLAIPADPTTVDPLTPTGAVPVDPVCRVGSLAECRNVSAFYPAYTADSGCMVNGGPALAGCGASRYFDGYTNLEARGCSVSVAVAGQGVTVACGDSSSTVGTMSYTNTSFQGCGGLLSTSAGSVALVCAQTGAGSAGGGGGVDHTQSFCGSPTLATGCTHNTSIYTSSYGGTDDYRRCSLGSVVSLTCDRYDMVGTGSPVHHDECAVVLSPPGGPTCTLTVVDLFDPPNAYIDQTRTGCV